MKTKENALMQIKSMLVEEPQSAEVKELLSKMIEKAAEAEMLAEDINAATEDIFLSSRPQIIKVNQMEGEICRQFGSNEFYTKTAFGREHISYIICKDEVCAINWHLYYDEEKKFGDINNIKIEKGNNNCFSQIDGTLPVTSKACLGIILDNQGKLKFYSTGFGFNIINKKRFVSEKEFEELLSDKRMRSDDGVLGMMKRIQERFAKVTKSKDDGNRSM